VETEQIATMVHLVETPRSVLSWQSVVDEDRVVLALPTQVDRVVVLTTTPMVVKAHNPHRALRREQMSLLTETWVVDPNQVTGVTQAVAVAVLVKQAAQERPPRAAMVEKESEMHFALVLRLSMDQVAAARGALFKVLVAQMLETPTEQVPWAELELMV
jgi:hypothetical protein